MLPLWTSFWLVALGFVLFRTFDLYRLLHFGVAFALLILCAASFPSKRFLERALIFGWPVLLLVIYSTGA